MEGIVFEASDPKSGMAQLCPPPPRVRPTAHVASMAEIAAVDGGAIELLSGDVEVFIEKMPSLHAIRKENGKRRVEKMGAQRKRARA